MKDDYVYLLSNANRSVLYVGLTNNLLRRLLEHRDGRGNAFTARYNVNTLVYVEVHDRIDEAIGREKQIKGWRRSKKNALVETMNPSWSDISGTVTG